MFCKVLLIGVFLLSGCYIFANPQCFQIVSCIIASLMFSIWVTTSNIRCENCGIEYNVCGNSHCCHCNKVYTSAICDSNGNAFTYSHCCKCNDEYSDDCDKHTCFKN